MDYISVSAFAQKHALSERTVRHYCTTGKLKGAFLTGKTWNIPTDALLPKRNKSKQTLSPLLKALQQQKAIKLKGSIYHRTQIDLTYNSNHIEGSCQAQDQKRHILETNTSGITDMGVKVDDIIETTNHFRCIDLIIEQAQQPLSEALIKKLHQVLKTGTSDTHYPWFHVGQYKQLPNEVGGQQTTTPEEVKQEMKALLESYHQITEKSFNDILHSHQRFETIHPFQDGNGRVGRLILFKECLANNIVPFIISDELKLFYYRGLREWNTIPEYLRDTCLTAQDHYKRLLDYFKIDY